jgi:outer membrane immunogenic protein
MKLVVAATAFAALVSGTAVAADLSRPVMKAAPMAPVTSWTGCYIGAQVGGQWGRDHTAEYITATGAFNNLNQHFNSDGFVGGGHIGCTWQTGVWVWGLEGDFEGASVDGGYRLANLNGTDFNLDWQGSIRGRLGWAVDRTLFYATGGVSFASLEYTYVATNTVFESFKDTQVGWTIGAGIEHAFAGNWTARVEYRFTDYGTISNNSLVAFPGFTYKHDPEFHAVRGYLTYRFGGPGRY